MTAAITTVLLGAVAFEVLLAIDALDAVVPGWLVAALQVGVVLAAGGLASVVTDQPWLALVGLTAAILARAVLAHGSDATGKCSSPGLDPEDGRETHETNQ